MTDLYDVIKAMIKRELSNLHTVTLARITKVNVNAKTVHCQPVINRVFADKSLPMPEFADVPLITLQGGSSYIHMPVAVGDYCLLFISERCFDRWYKGNDNMPPLSERMFDYSDSFAIVGVNPEAKAIDIPTVIQQTGDTNQDGDYTHQGNTTHTGDYEQEGDYTQVGDQTITGNITVTGNLTINGNLTVSGVITTPILAVGAIIAMPGASTPPNIPAITIDQATIGGVDMGTHKHTDSIGGTTSEPQG
jgi:hypothetical protein